jgi:hypothetical protein
MKSFQKSLLASIAFIIFFSCTPDAPVVKREVFESGIFVVNQGVFQSGTGTISHKPFSDMSFTTDIYSKANGGKVLGNIVQSMIKVNDKYFIAVNNANKIEVVDAKTFVQSATISNIPQPRYFASANGNLYISAWGADSKSGEIYIVDPISMTIKAKIKTDFAPEQMLVSGSSLYVTLSSPYGISSKDVAVIDLNTNTISNRLQTASGPSSLVQDKNGDIWVLCSGTYGFNPSDNELGGIVQIKDAQVTPISTLPTGASGLAIDKTKATIYYISDGKVFSIDINNPDSPKVVTNGFYYSIAYSAVDNSLYLNDPKDYTGNGNLEVFSLDTKTKKAYQVGIIPGFTYIVE